MQVEKNMKKKTSKLATIKRLLKYVTSNYKIQLVVVFVSIIISAIVGVIGIEFIKFLIDDFITPLMTAQNPDFTDLFNVICMMALVYLAGVIATYIYNRIMITIAQGTLQRVRKLIL